MSTFLLILLFCFLTAILSSAVTKKNLQKYAETQSCPFKHACLHYDNIETKNAIKRVLKLMITHNVPTNEIHDIIDKELK